MPRSLQQKRQLWKNQQKNLWQKNLWQKNLWQKSLQQKRQLQKSLQPKNPQQRNPQKIFLQQIPPPMESAMKMWFTTMKRQILVVSPGSGR